MGSRRGGACQVSFGSLGYGGSGDRFAQPGVATRRCDAIGIGLNERSRAAW
jgi:hypothetical protein